MMVVLELINIKVVIVHCTVHIHYNIHTFNEIYRPHFEFPKGNIENE